MVESFDEETWKFNLVLLDLGLGKQTESLSDLTLAGNKMFQCPDFDKEIKPEFKTKIDIWSLAVIFIHLTWPFSFKTYSSKLYKDIPSFQLLEHIDQYYDKNNQI